MANQVDISKLTQLVVEGAPPNVTAISKLSLLVVEGPTIPLAISKLSLLVVEGPAATPSSGRRRGFMSFVP